MTVVPAVVAGVEEIVLCTPPQRDGVAATPRCCTRPRRAGATHVAKTGGAQAIGALAYGTERSARSTASSGPGNAYVTEAKRQVRGFVGIDGLAGPSELTIVAERDADPRCARSTWSRRRSTTPTRARTSSRPTPRWSRGRGGARTRGRRPRVAARSSEPRCGTHARSSSATEHAGRTAVDDLAAEHLLVLLPDPRAFLGADPQRRRDLPGPVDRRPFGDYGVASNHVLPTAGTARFAQRPAGGRLRHGALRRGDGRGRGARAAPEAVHDRPQPRGSSGHARAMDVRSAERGRPRMTRPPSRARACATWRRTCRRSSTSPRASTRTSAPSRSPRLRRRPRRGGARPAAEPLSRTARCAGCGRTSRPRAATRSTGTWAANGSNEIITELLLAYGGPGRRRSSSSPRTCCTRACRGSPTPSSPAATLGRRLRRSPSAQVADAIAADARRRVRLLAEQPDRQRAAAGGDPRARRALPRSLVIVDEAYVRVRRRDRR